MSEISFMEEIYMTRSKVCRNRGIGLHELLEEPQRSNITTNCSNGIRFELTREADEGGVGVSRSTPKRACHKLSIVKRPTRPHIKKYVHCFSELTNESDDSTETSSKCSQAHSGVYQASPKKNKAVSVSDTRMVTVKATFKDDMIKFQFHLSSGVMELKNQVAQRLKLISTRLRLKYADEDGDLILISCDADLRSLMPFSASSVGKNTVKLIVENAGE